MKKIFFLLGVVMSLNAGIKTIVFGAGCFWGVEKYFDSLKGVRSATSGYAGGNYENPTYRDVLDNRNPKSGVINHTEVVEVVYDTSEISTRDLIERFWELHDPTQGDRQGNDIGNNYRSAIYYTDKEQKETALKTKEEYQKLLRKAGYGEITTEIKPLEKFYKAEEYHQNYLKKNPNGYCPNHSTGVKFPKKDLKETKNKSSLKPLGGKEVVVVVSDGCPYCEKFKKDVVEGYRGSTPIRMAKQDELEGFKIKTKIAGTPTILYIEDGVEKFSFVGYLEPESFYRALGGFKLGRDSEAYDVAFNASTDRRFCKRYEEFKDTPDGVFVDKISGDILFDTRDRFNSGSGWLSFYKAVDGSVVEREDNSFGMRRIEVVAKKSGAHLGHVFDDAPGGKRRFCINATVLEFVPRDKIKK
jgi:peptide methionine sulfoxide reductase msrA/msrB